VILLDQEQKKVKQGGIIRNDERRLVSYVHYAMYHQEKVDDGSIHRAVLSAVEKLLLTLVLEVYRGNQVWSAAI
jgi:DNA-binding protein Fis